MQPLGLGREKRAQAAVLDLLIATRVRGEASQCFDYQLITTNGQRCAILRSIGLIGWQNDSTLVPMGARHKAWLNLLPVQTLMPL